MMTINVLAVVASPRGLPMLASSEEVARVQDIRGVLMRTVTDATPERIASMLSGEQFDVFLWLGHGGPGVLLTQDGGQIGPQWLAAQLSSRRVQIAVLATCESDVRPPGGGQQAAKAFSEALPAAGIDTITMAMAVGDRTAIEYDVELLRQLAAGVVLRMAHDVAVNKLTTLCLDWQAPKLTPRDRHRSEQAVADARFQTTDMLLQGLTRKMDGIDDKMDRMEQRQNGLDNRLQALEERLAAPAGYGLNLLVGGAAVALAMILLLVVIGRL